MTELNFLALSQLLCVVTLWCLSFAGANINTQKQRGARLDKQLSDFSVAQYIGPTSMCYVQKHAQLITYNNLAFAHKLSKLFAQVRLFFLLSLLSCTFFSCPARLFLLLGRRGFLLCFSRSARPFLTIRKFFFLSFSKFVRPPP